MVELGVSPFFAFQLAFAFFALLYWMGRGFSIPVGWSNFTVWYTAFTLLAVVSAITLPVIFDGILVYAPKGGIDEQYFSRSILHLSAANFSQAVFLILYWVSTMYFITKKIPVPEVYFEKAYLWTGAVVLFFGYYQAISIATGIYYPKDILLNNTSYGIADEVNIGILPRIHSVFTEPSFYAMFLVGMFAWVYIKFLAESKKFMRLRWVGLLVLVAVGLFFSASTTGYVAVVLFFGLHSIYTLFSGRNRSHLKFVLIFIVVIFGGCVALYFFVDGFDVIFDLVLLSKGESDSSLHRLASDAFAFSILHETYYLGAGLGSNRPSSMIALLVSNVGVIGTIFALFTSYMLMTRGIAARQGINDLRLLSGVEATGWALVAMLISKIIAGPDLNFPPMWILISYHIVSIRALLAKRSSVPPPSGCQPLNC